LLAGQNLVRVLAGQAPYQLPHITMLGALCRYITEADDKDFQPMKANFGNMPPLETRVVKRERGKAYAERALTDLRIMLNDIAEGMIVNA